MFNMGRFNPVTFLFSIILMVIVAAVTLTPVANPIKSLDETYAMLEQLDMHWDQPGVPVVVFASNGCPHSRALEATLQKRRVTYLRVDIYSSKLAQDIHGELGVNYLGTVGTRATPTTVVGTRVIRGNDVGAIMEAIAEENQSHP